MAVRCRQNSARVGTAVRGAAVKCKRTYGVKPRYACAARRCRAQTQRRMYRQQLVKGAVRGARMCVVVRAARRTRSSGASSAVGAAAGKIGTGRRAVQCARWVGMCSRTRQKQGWQAAGSAVYAAGARAVRGGGGAGGGHTHHPITPGGGAAQWGRGSWGRGLPPPPRVGLGCGCSHLFTTYN